MRNRLVAVAALAAAVALTAPAALAAPAPATMDGKKVKELVIKANGGVQSHDNDLSSSDERIQCEPPRCAVLPFIYKPAKGVKDGLMFSVTWTSPLADMDLYVAQVGKGGRTEVTHCGGVGTTLERLYVPASELKVGKTYALIVDFYRSVNEDITGRVAFGPDETKKPFPSQVDDAVYPMNCTQ